MKGKVHEHENESMGSIKENVASELNDNHSSVKFVVTVALALWLGLVFLLGARGGFVRPPDSPPLPIFLRLGNSFGGVFAAYFSWSAFRAFVLGADLRLVAAIQAWRWAGSGFLLLYARVFCPDCSPSRLDSGTWRLGSARRGSCSGLFATRHSPPAGGMWFGISWGSSTLLSPCPWAQ